MNQMNQNNNNGIGYLPSQMSNSINGFSQFGNPFQASQMQYMNQANGNGVNVIQPRSNGSYQYAPNGDQGQASVQNTDSHMNQELMKFLLKLKNNNIQNLKNALRKLGERTQGNKEHLLVRLAKKLATPEGRQMVKQNFRQEVYKQLYEVEIQGNFQKIAQDTGMTRLIQQSAMNSNQQQIPQNGQNNQNNRRFLNPMDALQQNNMIPQTFGSNYQPNIVPQPIPQTQPASFANGLNPLLTNQQVRSQQAQVMTQQVQRQPQVSTVVDIIDIDSDSISPDKSAMLMNNVNQIQMQQNRNLNNPQEENEANFISNGNETIKDMQKISYNQIMMSNNYPCLLDEPNQINKSQVQCFCENYNSLYYQEANRDMRTAQSGGIHQYVCHQCQFMIIDPFAVPIETLLRPFKIAKLTTQQVKSKTEQKAWKEFVIKESLFAEITKFNNLKESSVRIQVRCIRLDTLGFEHCWPKFGGMSINNNPHPEFRMPDPPNDQKKRKDDMYDITSLVRRPKNRLEIFQEQKNHDGYFQHPGHICAVFVVKVIQPHDIINFIKTQRIEEPQLSLKRAEQFFGNSSSGSADQDICEIETEFAQQVSTTTLCPITRKPIKYAARGELCRHLECFDLETYVNMNHQHKRWKCPSCNKRAHSLMIDSYFSQIVDLMNNLKQSDPYTKDKIQIDSNLNIIVQASDEQQDTYFKLVRLQQSDQNESGVNFKYDINERQIISKNQELNSKKQDSQDTTSGSTLNKDQLSPATGNASQNKEGNEASDGKAANSNNEAVNNKRKGIQTGEIALQDAICLDSDDEMH
ncbi:miz zinc finger family protein [Stylonychia lemnae]|uniref:Miz zinc finger family protein n=1 Tax=Stylonychia lemnae TaxID=5949 RepID=A0A078AID2_STYLE|nr:miz zinc finger family protein [Stylonychia lemnae]|eukprot:CDW81262.1 miz zinc finger family protein [Stylonychia lemnae]